ncbi:MAG: YciI family protein [Aeromicrobium sp.]
MTQYLLSVHPPQSVYDLPIEQKQASWDATGVFNEEIKAEGVWVFTGGLKSVENATTVNGTGDKVVITDGPFAETKEHLGGFWIVEVPDLDAALKLAARGSKACGETVEVRPFEGE